MARYSVGGRTVTNLPTTVRGPNIYGNGSVACKVREIGVFNTTTTAFAVAVSRATATGTRAGQLTVTRHDTTSGAATAAVYTSQSADATITADPVAQASIGASVGSGMVWTFGDTGLVIPATSNAGLVLICPTGTAQHFDFYIVWDE